MDIDDTGVPSNRGFDPEFAAAADWATLYRSAGVQIVPCKDKHPVLKSWKEYQHALVPDDVFDKWYGPQGEFRNSFDMGALTGLASGRLLMIDLDLYKGPAAGQWWHGVLAVHNSGMKLETWQQVTGGGGRQMFFTYPPNWKFSVNAKTDLNIDIRCQGGFTVLPPTKHASGKSYVWDPGCAPWEIDIAVAPDWLLEEVERLIREHGGGSQAATTATTATASTASFDAFGHQTDGRESKMRDLIWGAVVDWRRECPIKPGEGESVARSLEKYRIYEDLVSPRIHEPGLTKAELLDREGRGPGVFAFKWQHAMGLWDTKVAEEAKKPGKDYGQNQTKTGEGFVHTPGDIFPYLDIGQILDQADPVWVVDGIINERALGFIFGPPSSLKTFIALDLALSIAARLPQWWDRGISRHGAVVYLCREGTSSFKQRIQAWEIHRKCAVRGIPFYLIEHPCNFMDAADVTKAVATIRAIMAAAGVPVAAVMVDTVSRVLPGAEENLQKDMTLFVRACELIQLEFQCIVIGVHHTNKNGAIRGSTVLPGAGDFLLETRRETGQDGGVMVVQKVKDGEDGVELPFSVTKVPLPFQRTSLVVDPNGSPTAARAAGPTWPDISVCRDILAELDRQWMAGTPWCYAVNSSRSAATNIMNKWQLKRDVVKDILAKWTANGVISELERDPKTHVKGYKKMMPI